MRRAGVGSPALTFLPRLQADDVAANNLCDLLRRDAKFDNEFSEAWPVRGLTVVSQAGVFRENFGWDANLAFAQANGVSEGVLHRWGERREFTGLGFSRLFGSGSLLVSGDDLSGPERAKNLSSVATIAPLTMRAKIADNPPRLALSGSD